VRFNGASECGGGRFPLFRQRVTKIYLLTLVLEGLLEQRGNLAPNFLQAGPKFGNRGLFCGLQLEVLLLTWQRG
jgi:hypothetical protein